VGVHGGAPELQSNPRAHIAHRSGCTLISQVPRKLHGAQDRARRVFGRAGRRWRVRRASRRQWAAACVHALQCGARRCRAVALSMSASERCPCACRVPMLSGHFFASLLLLMWYQYGQNTSPTVYITAIQMAPSGERFFRSSCAPLCSDLKVWHKHCGSQPQPLRHYHSDHRHPGSGTGSGTGSGATGIGRWYQGTGSPSFDFGTATLSLNRCAKYALTSLTRYYVLWSHTDPHADPNNYASLDSCVH
jgi:hypothetical protein